MPSHTLSILSALSADFSIHGASEKLSLLRLMKAEKLSVADLKTYHDKLLFICAYPDNEQVLRLALEELNRLADHLKSNTELTGKLLNTGIGASVTQSTFSLCLLTWITKNFPGTVLFHSLEEHAPHPKDILRHFLPAEEFEILYDDKLKPRKWLEKASGTTHKGELLHWLLSVFNASTLKSTIKEHFFESLKVYVEIRPVERTFSRTAGRISVESIYYHDEPLIKKFNERQLIEKPLPRETKLNPAQKQQIISCSRIALCLLQRETDPVTYSEEGNIRYFQLERGLSIALFGIDKDQRLPLESYIGFMMFKNGYPMSYGGAWLFEKRALIGINIFEPFRGGESAIVFAQLLRCYHGAFGVNYFEVEPYQFGKNNPEGIKSGAFWFYYRFGFRPVRNDLKALAEQERLKISSVKGYRTSFEVLKEFTLSNLALSLDGLNTPLNPSDLSRYLTDTINTDFNGNRSAARKACKRMLKQERLLSAENSEGAEMLGMFIAFCIDLQDLNESQRLLLKKLIGAKAGDEFEYIRMLNKFRISKHLNGGVKRFLSS